MFVFLSLFAVKVWFHILILYDFIAIIGIANYIRIVEREREIKLERRERQIVKPEK